MDIKKPRIIEGICEYCGIPSVECSHFGGAPKRPEKATIEIAVVEPRVGNPLKEKVADVIIAHWDRRDMLYQTLGSLPLNGLNVVVVRGHTYSKANNIGYKAAITDNIIFCNDDMILSNHTLLELVKSKTDFTMARQFYPDGSAQHCGMKWVDNDFIVVADPSEADIPTAACFCVKRSAFEKLGGFNERFINGGEDHDLFFRAIEKGFSFSFADTPVIHYCSQSSGRFDYEAENFKILKELWPKDKLAGLIKKIRNNNL